MFTRAVTEAAKLGGPGEVVPKTTDDLPHLPDPWERLADEPPKSFAAFTRYRDLDPLERSLSRAAREFVDSPSGRRRSHAAVLREWQRWSAEWSWVARAQQYDEHMDAVRRGAHALAVRLMAERHVEAAQQFITKGLAALAGVKLDEMRPRDVLRFVTEGARLERLARGEPDPEAGILSGESSPQESVRELLSSSPEVAKAAAVLQGTVARARRERGA